MAFLLMTNLVGVPAIATPTLIPVLAFVLAQMDEPFSRVCWTMRLGTTWGRMVRANRYGETAALAAATLFRLVSLLPAQTDRTTERLATIGFRLAIWATSVRGAGAGSRLLGLSTGLVLTPCGGPVLGLVLPV